MAGDLSSETGRSLAAVEIGLADGRSAHRMGVLVSVDVLDAPFFGVRAVRQANARERLAKVEPHQRIEDRAGLDIYDVNGVPEIITVDVVGNGHAFRISNAGGARSFLQ